MYRDRLRQLANILALVVTVIFNTVSQIPSFGFGVGTNAEIANRYPDLYYFPANTAFSIWSIIYGFLIAFVIYQALPSQQENPHLRRIGYLFVLTNIFNVGWIASFQYEQFTLSMVMMLLLLGTLITIYLRLGVGRTPVTTREKWLIHIPFSLYLGWITAATVTNAAYVLRDANWSGFGVAPELWAAVMLIVTGLIGLVMAVRHRDVAYVLVIAWATFWIASRHSGVQLVVVPALAVAGLMVVAALLTTFNNNRPTSLIASRSAA
jgi:hypothetical protein